MSIYEGLILTFILVGIIIIIVSIVLSKYERFVETEETKKLEKKLDGQVDYEEVREKILELNEYGEYLKGELDKKHKELLFLYQMILEKQKELGIDSIQKQVEQTKGDNKIKLKQNKQNNDMLNTENESPKEPGDDKFQVDNEETSKNYNKEIIRLSLAGYPTSEIAKKLKIGSGQVEMVLNLYK